MGKKTTRLTHERLVEVMKYDARSGSFTWLGRSGKRTRGLPAGCVGHDGYVRILLDGEIFLGHRLAWFYVHRAWPDRQVGFVNGKRTDLRLRNLRPINPGGDSPKALDLDRLRELLEFDEKTGVFKWLKPPSNRTAKRSVAGVVTGAGYRYIRVDRKSYLAHRLAWLYVHGEWPKNLIDHINLVRDDNRIANLRQATSAQNGHNARLRSTNRSGLKGVSWSASKARWHARIVANYVTYPLGYFDTKEQAHEAYQVAARRLHGEFART